MKGRKDPSVHQCLNFGAVCAKDEGQLFSNSEISHSPDTALVLRIATLTANVSNSFSRVLTIKVNYNIVRHESIMRK